MRSPLEGLSVDQIEEIKEAIGSHPRITTFGICAILASASVITSHHISDREPDTPPTPSGGTIALTIPSPSPEDD